MKMNKTKLITEQTFNIITLGSSHLELLYFC
nr:MAG TPA: hypothetical protein [Caudoviricetes sp.]